MFEAGDATNEHMEHMEHVEHAKGAAHRPDDLSMRVAIGSALMIVVSAAIASFEGQETSHALVLKNDAAVYQNKASDQWAYYQAKGLKQSIAQLQVDLNIGDVDKRRADVARYGVEQQAIAKDAKELEAKVAAANAHAEASLRRHAPLSWGDTLLKIAAVVASITILTRRKAFWYGSILVAVLGIGVAATAFIGAPMVTEAAAH